MLRVTPAPPAPPAYPVPPPLAPPAPPATLRVPVLLMNERVTIMIAPPPPPPAPDWLLNPPAVPAAPAQLIVPVISISFATTITTPPPRPPISTVPVFMASPPGAPPRDSMSRLCSKSCSNVPPAAELPALPALAAAPVPPDSSGVGNPPSESVPPPPPPDAVAPAYGAERAVVLVYGEVPLDVIVPAMVARPVQRMIAFPLRLTAGLMVFEPPLVNVKSVYLYSPGVMLHA